MKIKGVEYGDECSLCGATKNLEIHHIVPISKGGTNETENLAILCDKCNSKIRNRIVPIIENQFEITQFGGNGTRENLRQQIEDVSELSIRISGETLKQAMTMRNDKETTTGKITPIAEVVWEAIEYLYKTWEETKQ